MRLEPYLAIWSLLLVCKLTATSATTTAAASVGAAEAQCSDEETSLPRIAFLILVHNRDTLLGASRLVDALYHHDHTFIVHFDTKMAAEEYHDGWKRMTDGRNENMVKLSLHNLEWGRWVMLAPWFSTARLLTDNSYSVEARAIEALDRAQDSETDTKKEVVEEGELDEEDMNEVFMVGGRKMGGGSLKKKNREKASPNEEIDQSSPKKKDGNGVGTMEKLASMATSEEVLAVASRPWDYLINLSGDAFPVLTPAALRRRLSQLVDPHSGQPLNFVTSSGGITGMRPAAWSEFDAGWHKRKAFPHPILEGTTAEAHFGSQFVFCSL